MQNSGAFLTYHHRSENKKIKNIPFVVEPENIKYLGRKQIKICMSYALMIIKHYREKL